MRTIARLIVLLSALVFGTAAVAQEEMQREYRPFPQAQLDAMLAPIALYPDSLLSQILMAATYPQEVAQAASWSRVYPGLKGDAAVRAAEGRDWDPSVVSLTAFPQVLTMMAERTEWTADLGEAYVGQPEQVLDTIQALRSRADAAGNLRSSDQLMVQRQGNDYLIDSPNPEVVHVPYYDPRVAYGPWWAAEYPPEYWNPWPGYNYAYGYPGFGWGYGIAVGAGFWFATADWRGRHVRYAHHRPWYHHGNWHGGTRWAHDRNRGDRYQGRWQNRGGDGRQNVRDGRQNGYVERWNRTDRGGQGQGGDRNRPRVDRVDAGAHGLRRAGTPDASPLQPAQGFFPQQQQQQQQQGPQQAQRTDGTQRYPGVRPAMPRYGMDGGGRRERPQGAEGYPRQQPQPAAAQAPAAPAHGLGRNDMRAYGAQPVTTKPVMQAPAAQPRVAAPAPAHVPRSAPAAAPSSSGLERSAPSAPPESRVADSPRSGGGGHGMGRRGRD